MRKVIVVVGPTAVGKTKISIDIAKRYGLEVISGDSVSVYKKLDIGSAKPTKEEMEGVIHHLIDIKEPIEQYSVADFQRDARSIINHNKVSLICGGTGLYIQSVLFDYNFEAKRRDFDFEKKYENYTNEELYSLLQAKDDSFDKTKIHPNNRKRVLRALEIIEDTNKCLDKFKNKIKPLYDYLIIYLNIENRQVLYERINKRVDMMVQSGLLDEVYSLYKEGICPHAIGYQEFIPYFNGDITLDTALEEVKKNSRHLAKRQMTWFRNQLSTKFYDITNSNCLKIIYSDIDKFLGSE